jgi:hypothetical protein
MRRALWPSHKGGVDPTLRVSSRADVQIDIWSRHSEIVEEDLRQLLVVGILYGIATRN